MRWTNNYFDSKGEYTDLTNKKSFKNAYLYARLNGLPYFTYNKKKYAAIDKGEVNNDKETWEKTLINKSLASANNDATLADYKLSQDANPFLNMTLDQVATILGNPKGYILNKDLFTFDKNGKKIIGYAPGVENYNLYNKDESSNKAVNNNTTTALASNTTPSTTTTNSSFKPFNSYSTNSGKLGESFANNYQKEQLQDMYKHALDFSGKYSNFNEVWKRLGGSLDWNELYDGLTNPFAIKHTKYTLGLEGLRSLIFMNDDQLKDMGLKNGSTDLNYLFLYILNNTIGGKNLNVEMHDWIKRMNKENDRLYKTYINSGNSNFTDYLWTLSPLRKSNGGIIINKWFGYKLRFNN